MVNVKNVRKIIDSKQSYTFTNSTDDITILKTYKIFMRQEGGENYERSVITVIDELATIGGFSSTAFYTLLGVFYVFGSPVAELDLAIAYQKLTQ
jgi:hypothetical protein